MMDPILEARRIARVTYIRWCDAGTRLRWAEEAAASAEVAYKQAADQLDRLEKAAVARAMKERDEMEVR